jgi:hypothetical protein
MLKIIKNRKDFVEDVLKMIDIQYMDILVLQEVIVNKMEEMKMELQELELLIQQHAYSHIVKLVIIEKMDNVF